jgi:hypothetical protein
VPLGAIGGAILAAGVVSAGVSLYEGNQANQTARGVANQQEFQSATIFGEQQGFEAQLQALIADPSSVTKLPGYSFNFGQGADAVQREMAAGGFQGSGNEATALTQYGQNFAMSTFNQQAQLLSQLAGITAPSSPSQGGAVAGNTVNNANANNIDNLNNTFANLGIVTGYFGKGGSFGSAGGINAAANSGTSALGP